MFKGEDSSSIMINYDRVGIMWIPLPPFVTNFPKKEGQNVERERQLLLSFRIFDEKSDFYPFFLPKYDENL